MDDFAAFYRECGTSGHIRNFNDKKDSVVLIEIRRILASGATEFENITLNGSDIEARLSTKTARPGTKVVLQLLQLTEKTDISRGHKYLDVSQKNFDAVLETFRLRSLLEYGTSEPQMFTSATEGSSDNLCTFSIVHVADYFTMFFQHGHTTELTRGICWTNDQIGGMLEWCLRDHQTWVAHPLLLNHCMAKALQFSTGQKLYTIYDDSSGLEVRTGHKVWLIAHCRPLDGDYHTLSAQSTGLSTLLAAHKRANGVFRQLLDSVSVFHTHSSGASGKFDEVAKQMAASTHLLLQRNESQLGLMEFLKKRVEDQKQALFNLIAQADTRITISLAEASKHDSSSMKILAAVTVIFLPGTFISSLFSTSLFDWQAEKITLVLNERFWLYWVITLPLTIITIGAWALWTRINTSGYHVQELRGRTQSCVDPEKAMNVVDRP